MLQNSQPDELDKGLTRAIREYEQVLLKDASWRKGPYLVSDNVSEAAFEQWRGGQETHWKLMWEPSALPDDANRGIGFVWLYGDPSMVHEYVIGFIGRMLVDQVRALGVTDDDVDLLPAPKVRLRARQKEPDYALRPAQSPFESCPTVIFEVAYQNESKRELRREINDWVEGDAFARIAIGINIKKKKATQTQAADVSVTVFFKRRGDSAITDVIRVERDGRSVSIPVEITSNDIFGQNVVAGMAPSCTLDLGSLEARLRTRIQQG